MGEIIEIPEEFLVPTQDILTHKDLFPIFHAFYNGYYEELPICPVRKDPLNSNLYLILDGHHRTSIAGLFDKTRKYFVAQSKDDEMIFSESNVKIKKDLDIMNLNICDRWPIIVDPEFRNSGAQTFDELRDYYNFLKDCNSAKEYFESLGYRLNQPLNYNNLVSEYAGGFLY